MTKAGFYMMMAGICLITLSIFLASGRKDRQPHRCIYDFCDYKGDMKFNGFKGGSRPGSLGWEVDSLHFYNPDEDF